MKIKELSEIIKGRRSIRKWKDQEVPDDLLLRAIELATWAPSGGNYQGWRFIVINNREILFRIRDAMQSVAERVSLWPEEKSFGKKDAKKLRKNASHFRNAPACIVILSVLYGYGHGRFRDKMLAAREFFDPEAKQIRESLRSAPENIQSTAAAITTLLLVLHAMGLGAVWLASPLVAKREIEEMLCVPENMGLISIVALGYPDESPQKSRKPVSEFIEFMR